MTTTDRVEFLLRRAVAVNPSDEGLRGLDERVARIMAGAASTQPHARGMRLRLLRPLALAAALLLAAGAVAASLGLLDQTIDQSAPGWRVAWDRAEIIGQRQTDGGVTVTLERAYADVNQVLVGFTVEGLESPTLGSGRQEPLSWTAGLRDPAGRPAEQWATSITAVGRDVTGLSAVIQTWLGTPLATAGTWELTVTSVGYSADGFVPGACTEGAIEPECVNPPVSRVVNGTWRFAFDLPVPAGALVVGPIDQTVGPATVTLTELRIGPSAITSRLALIVDGEAVSAWGPTNASIGFAGSSYELVNATHITTDPAERGPHGDENEYPIDTGVAAPAGSWRIEIPELWYVTADRDGDAAITLRGPWILEVTVP